MLKPGGRLAVADMVAAEPLPEEVQNDLSLYVGCVAGAVFVDDLETMLAEAGFLILIVLFQGNPLIRGIGVIVPAGLNYRSGVLLGLSAAVVYALFVIALRKLQTNVTARDALSNFAVVSLLCAVLMGFEGWIQGESFHIPDQNSWLAMIALGVFCQALGWVLISKGLPSVAASRAGLLLLLQPTGAFLWDILIFQRTTTGLEYLGPGWYLSGNKIEIVRKGRREAMITIDDFRRRELRVGQVVSAEPITGTNRLLKVGVDLGEEQRNLVAGLAAYYAPEQLLGEKVVVVTNMQPATICGIRSEGMILGAGCTSGRDAT